MKRTNAMTLALSLTLTIGLSARTVSAQETIGGLTVLNPNTNMYMPFAQNQKIIAGRDNFSTQRHDMVQVRSRRSVQVPRQQVMPVPQGEVDVQSYKVSPVPSFLIEEAMEHRAKNGMQVTTTIPGVVTVDGDNELANLNMGVGEVKEAEEKKKDVKPYVRRPKLWYGGPWRKG